MMLVHHRLGFPDMTRLAYYLKRDVIKAICALDSKINNIEIL